MSSPTELAREAARLISFALRPKLAAGTDETYARLCSEYRVDAEFRSIVDAVATGLDLSVLAVTDYGLIVAAETDSVFEFRLGDYARNNWTPEVKLLTGLAHVGIAASCYPREDDLESDITVRRSLVQIEALITEVCKQQADEVEDRDAVSGDERDVWQLWLDTPQTLSTKGGRYQAGCRLGILQRACDWLEEQGFARKAKTAGSYQFNDRFRIQIRDLAGNEALERLRTAAETASETPEGESSSDEGDQS